MEKVVKFFDKFRDDSAISLKDSNLELHSEVCHIADAQARYADGNHRGLVNLGHIAFFNKYRLINSSGKEIEENDFAHVICLKYKLLSSSRDSDNLSVGFHRSIEAREKELTIT